MNMGKKKKIERKGRKRKHPSPFWGREMLSWIVRNAYKMGAKRR